MDNLVPRLIEEPESRKLGIQPGWYGARTSGTFVTGRCSTHNECLELIDQLPKPAIKTLLPIDGQGLPSRANKPGFSYPSLGPLFQTAYQIGHKPPGQKIG